MTSCQRHVVIETGLRAAPLIVYMHHGSQCAHEHTSGPLSLPEGMQDLLHSARMLARDQAADGSKKAGQLGMGVHTTDVLARRAHKAPPPVVWPPSACEHAPSRRTPALLALPATANPAHMLANMSA